MDWWHIEIPVPVALAFMAAVGYLISRRSRSAANDMMLRSRRELKRAQGVAAELEKIAWTVRQSLATHHSSVSRFRERVGRLSDRQQEAAWKELCREAEDVLRPTLQLATQIAHAYDEIRQQSANLMTFTEVRTDPLTGVNNRRGLDNALNAQFAIKMRYNASFALVLFDIDHFKRVNDQQGHLHGDHVLQELAQLLDQSVRETDVVARYGGEEFVVVMPHTDMAGACIFAERLRLRVAEQLPITISGGVAAAAENDTQESLVARADAALYSARRPAAIRSSVIRARGPNRLSWTRTRSTPTAIRRTRGKAPERGRQRPAFLIVSLCRSRPLGTSRVQAEAVSQQAIVNGPCGAGLVAAQITLGRVSSRSSGLSDSPRHSSFAHAPLPQRVAVADGHGAVRERLAVDGDAERRAHLVLTAIAAAHGPLLVVKHGQVRLRASCRFRGPPRACRPS